MVDENAADLKAYGLAEPRIDVTFHVEGEKEPKRILLGEKTPANSGTYAKLPSGNRVFLVATALETAADKPTFDFRDKAALAFDQAKVTSLELASAAQTIRLEKTGEEWKLVKPVQAPADFVSVSGLLGQLQSAQMTALKERPEDLKDLKQYGLDKPVVVATIGTGASSMKFELGKEADPGSVWGRDPSKAAVFSINNGVAMELQKKVDDFRRKEVFDFRPFNTTRFEITRGKDTRAFERVKGTGENAVDTWKQVAPAAKTVDSSNLEGALLDFSNLRAESFVATAGAATGHNNPAAVIVVKFDDGKKEERVVIGTAGSGVFATRADQPGALKIEAGQVRRRHQEARRPAVRLDLSRALPISVRSRRDARRHRPRRRCLRLPRAEPREGRGYAGRRRRATRTPVQQLQADLSAIFETPQFERSFWSVLVRPADSTRRPLRAERRRS